MKPTETIIEQRNGDKTVRCEHPAMAVVVVSRPSTNGTRLFGSDIAHHHLISIEVKRAVVDRHLNRDWVHSEESIVEFSLSMAQWAQLVASVGMGEGTPVTLTRAPEAGTPIHHAPPIESDSVRDVFEREIAEAAQSASQDVKRVQGMIQEFLRPGAKKPGKADLEAMHNALLHAGKHFESNMGCVLNSFQRAMEETTEAAKTEVEMFVAGVAQRTGLESLRNGGVPALGHDQKED